MFTKHLYETVILINCYTCNPNFLNQLYGVRKVSEKQAHNSTETFRVMLFMLNTVVPVSLVNLNDHFIFTSI